MSRAIPRHVVHFRTHTEVLLRSPTYGDYWFQIDTADWDQHCWRRFALCGARKNPRVQASTGTSKSEVLARLLMSPVPPGMEVDHLDIHGRNNRRENLRVVSRGHNKANQKKRKGATSLFKGVTWCKEHKKWKAQTQSGGQHKNLGYYNTEEEAARAYDAAARAQFGPCARLNFPDEGEAQA